MFPCIYSRLKLDLFLRGWRSLESNMVRICDKDTKAPLPQRDMKNHQGRRRWKWFHIHRSRRWVAWKTAQQQSPTGLMPQPLNNISEWNEVVIWSLIILWSYHGCETNGHEHKNDYRNIKTLCDHLGHLQCRKPHGLLFLLKTDKQKDDSQLIITLRNLPLTKIMQHLSTNQK